jgi:hypothetical protein
VVRDAQADARFCKSAGHRRAARSLLLRRPPAHSRQTGTRHVVFDRSRTAQHQQSRVGCARAPCAPGRARARAAPPPTVARRIAGVGARGAAFERALGGDDRARHAQSTHSITLLATSIVTCTTSCTPRARERGTRRRWPKRRPERQERRAHPKQTPAAAVRQALARAAPRVQYRATRSPARMPAVVATSPHGARCRGALCCCSFR